MAASATPSNMPARRSPTLSMEARMTLCNMSIEAGSRVGMVAPDETTFAYRQGPPAGARRRRSGTRRSPIGAACAATPTRVFDREVELDVSALAPHVSWGTNPGRDRADHRPRARPGRRARPRPPRQDASAASPTWA